MMAEIAATLAFSSIQNKDKVGVIFFSDKIEKFIPPKKGLSHILLIIREIINFQPTQVATDINVALEFMNRAVKKRATAFLLSDFIDDHDYSKAITISARKHDLAAIQVYDKRDATLPNVGLIRVKDIERNTYKWVDTSSAAVRKAYDRLWYGRQQDITETMNRSGVDMVSIATDEDFVKTLLALFRNRGAKR
jgi:uncharacterized protein (DUF58 family)